MGAPSGPAPPLLCWQSRSSPEAENNSGTGRQLPFVSCCRTSSICSSVRKSQKPSIISTASLVPATIRSRLLRCCSSTVGLITSRPNPPSAAALSSSSEGSRPTRTPATARRIGTSAGRQAGWVRKDEVRCWCRSASDCDCGGKRIGTTPPGTHRPQVPPPRPAGEQRSAPDSASAAPAAVMASGSGECCPS